MQAASPPCVSKQDLKRFWKRVNKDGPNGCWNWVGYIDKGGYGRFTLNSRLHLAQRAAWLILHGDIPVGLCVCHNCPGGDNARCVNPDHLFLDTQAGNIEDKRKKGRCAHNGLITLGSKNGQSKLCDFSVKLIRELYFRNGAQQTAIAKRFGVARTCVSAIISGRTWKHVPLTNNLVLSQSTQI